MFSLVLNVDINPCKILEVHEQTLVTSYLVRYLTTTIIIQIKHARHSSTSTRVVKNQFQISKCTTKLPILVIRISE